MAKLNFRRELFLAYPKWSPHVLFMIRTTAYTQATGLSLLQGWQAPVLDHTPTWRLTNYFRRSEDNGRTWSISTPDLPDEPTAEGLLRRDNVLLFLDPGSGLLIRAYHLMHAKERGEQIENCRNFYQISRDGGISWEDERQIIQKGREYDESHWARDVDMGRNAGMIAGILKVEKLADGTLLLPIQMGNNRDFHLRQAVFRGRWREDLSDIDWDVGDYVSVPPEQSKVGVYAGSVSELPDGRVLLLLRAAGDGNDRLPGMVQYLAISQDGGWTWDDPRPLTYTDDSPVWFCSANPRLVGSEKNGRLYLITHITEHPRKNEPRQPLCIVEIDQQRCQAIRETRTVLVSQEDEPEPEAEKFFFIYRSLHQDRESGNLVLYITNQYRGPERPGTMRIEKCEIEMP